MNIFQQVLETLLCLCVFLVPLNRNLLFPIIMIRNNIIQRIILLLILFLVYPLSLLAKTINPLEYGLRQAKTGEERFKVLYQTHSIAKKNKWNVSYKGIGELKIDIPSNAKSIPLGNVTDFSNVVLLVTNTNKDNFFLFELSQDLHPVLVTKSLFDTFDFSRIKELNHGFKILVVEDQNPWVENREGYNYGAIRKDILLLENGNALNKTIAPYNTDTSKPSCKYIEVTTEQKSISNITLKRSKESTAKTFLVKVMNMNNVLLQDINIITPTPVVMIADNAINIINCTNIYFKHVTINQTYSTSDKSGYGISMNNVWNSWFDKIECDAAWGLFGNNNINTAHVNNSKINRFDTHCYGKDFCLSNCEITQIGLPQSSFMGKLEFSKCTFRSAYICSARTDYNAFSSFNISIRDCIINLDSHHRSLINVGNVNNKVNKRKELRLKSVPSLFIKNTRVVLTEDIPNWSLVHVGSRSGEQPFDYIGDIIIDGLNVIGSHANLMIFDCPIQSRHHVNIDLKGVDLIGNDNLFRVSAKEKFVYTPTIVFNINKDGSDVYYLKDSKLNYNPLEFPHYNLHLSNCILGRIRYYNINNGDVSSRRKYTNCIFYLNDIDTNNYTLDDNADYIGCSFLPIKKNKKVVPYSMKKTSEMTFEKCSSDVNDLFGPKLPKSKDILKSHKYKFSK